MSDFNKKHSALWDDLLDVTEKYCDDFNIPQMSSIILQFAATMALDCAPTLDDAEEVLQDALDYMVDGYRREAAND